MSRAPWGFTLNAAGSCLPCGRNLACVRERTDVGHARRYGDFVAIRHLRGISGARRQAVPVGVNHEIGNHAMPRTSFLADIQTLRKRTRQHIHEGTVAPGYSAEREIVLKLLNDSLATELVCVRRYRRQYTMTQGIHSQSVAQEFLDHSNEEQGDADEIAARIVQLGGAPDFAPEGLVGRTHAEYVEGDSLVGMIKEDLVAERIAIDNYRQIIQYLGEQDATTRCMMEEILAMEEEHADELAELPVVLPKESPGKRRFAKAK
jgi:bacterioferritin